MPSPSLAEVTLKAIEELHQEIQRLIRKIPGAHSDGLYRSFRILGDLEAVAKRRVDENTYEAHRRRMDDQDPEGQIVVPRG